MSPTPSSTSNGSSVMPSRSESNTTSFEDSRTSITYGAPGALPNRQEAMEFYSYAIATFVDHEIHPFLPAGIFDLSADPSEHQSILDATSNRSDMARTLDMILLPFSPSGGAIVDGETLLSTMGTYFQSQYPLDAVSSLQQSYDTAGLAPLSDNDDLTEPPSPA